MIIEICKKDEVILLDTSTLTADEMQEQYPDYFDKAEYCNRVCVAMGAVDAVVMSCAHSMSLGFMMFVEQKDWVHAAAYLNDELAAGRMEQYIYDIYMSCLPVGMV